jgi:hypothetical protein
MSCRWQSGLRAFLDVSMAIATVDSQLADMVPMAERYRLMRGSIGGGNVGGVGDPDGADESA